MNINFIKIIEVIIAMLVGIVVVNYTQDIFVSVIFIVLIWITYYLITIYINNKKKK